MVLDEALEQSRRLGNPIFVVTRLGLNAAGPESGPNDVATLHLCVAVPRQQQIGFHVAFSLHGDPAPGFTHEFVSDQL